jgi:hypothetical protein
MQQHMNTLRYPISSNRPGAENGNATGSALVTLPPNSDPNPTPCPSSANGARSAPRTAPAHDWSLSPAFVEDDGSDDGLAGPTRD